ncbi:DNA polymerase LigD, ligase domain protein [Beijerinckiaceae bacterium RH AL1]|nr:non-homologous end-joining DNA ligase [Beijerinckiaceae bacterium]VVB42613.1 DNA polymerase LigD, ligase domain protein [Beijerinckiaceae bacterium RH AL8]VVB42618.1 DNA polymerase LigD, ligase domain protein [Beijerinckiaceae bacterium RH CH11]VVC53407.1 DNA polymerase LigD, ligase domain protein [Beijerinckiaceae bacterium RH AL1]
MASPPRRPIKRRTNAPRDVVADRAIVAKRVDRHQAGLFDEPLPKWIRPCLPTLVEKPPAGPQWVHEIKWDGYRVSAYVAGGHTTIRTRNGHDWTTRFPTIAAAAARLKVRSAVIDGEAVILDDRGRSSFAELQTDLDRHGSGRAVLYAFDLLFLDGEPLWKKPLEERRLALGGIIPKRSAILLSEDFAGSGADLFKIACENELEGIVSKRLDRGYHPGRSRDWLKTKCIQSDTFVIIGFQPGSGAVRAPLANIKIARSDGARLRYAGAVGTGFSERVAAALRERFDRIQTERCPVAGLKVSGAVWVSPDLRALVAYRGITTAGELRHASFKGLEE